MTAPTYAAVDAYLQQQIRRLRIPGLALAIVEGDRIACTRGFGCARPRGETPSPQTPFVLGSTTKSFTALAVMQLAEDGKVDLDAPVAALPALVSRGRPAGIRRDHRAPAAQPDQRLAHDTRHGPPG